MLVVSNPEQVHPPLGAYSHVVVVPPGSEVLFISGQVGIRPDGVTPPTIGEQADQVFANIKAILDGHGSAAADIAKLTTFIVAGQDGAAVRDARIRFLGPHHPASTTVYVSQLVDPVWLVEIEAVVVKPTLPIGDERARSRS
jgi:enamine deaminase RidA (YjgF/YER057c/UK114 family)